MESETLEMHVSMIEPEIVRQIRGLRALKWSLRRIARELEIDRRTVRRYLEGGEAAEVQIRPAARRLTEKQRAEAVRLFDGEAEGNAVVVHQLLVERGVDADVRTIQRAVASHRKERTTRELATVRFETAPGHQLQIDFGEKWVWVGSERRRVAMGIKIAHFPVVKTLEEFDFKFQPSIDGKLVREHHQRRELSTEDEEARRPPRP